MTLKPVLKESRSCLLQKNGENLPFTTDSKITRLLKIIIATGTVAIVFCLLYHIHYCLFGH